MKDQIEIRPYAVIAAGRLCLLAKSKGHKTDATQSAIALQSAIKLRDLHDEIGMWDETNFWKEVVAWLHHNKAERNSVALMSVSVAIEEGHIV